MKYFKGHKHPKKIREKIKATLTGHIVSEETRKKISETKTGVRLSAEHRAKIKASNTGLKRSLEFCSNMSKRWKGKKKTQRHREKLSAATPLLFQDPVFCANYARGMNMKPNKAELQLLALLEDLYPGEWKYTGDFSFVINGKNPDFVCCNGQKKVIELWGDYWHKGEDPQERAKVFRPFGYKTLVIWERELKGVKLLTRRIHRFMKANNSHAKGGSK